MGKGNGVYSRWQGQGDGVLNHAVTTCNMHLFAFLRKSLEHENNLIILLQASQFIKCTFDTKISFFAKKKQGSYLKLLANEKNLNFKGVL